MNNFLLQPKRGLTPINIILGAAIFTLVMVGFINLFMLETKNQTNLQSQYSLIVADSIMSDLYRDFNDCDAFDVTNTEEYTIITFEHDGTSTTYSFDVGDRYIYRDGLQILKCLDFSATVTDYTMIVNLKLKDEKLLSMQAYR